LPTLPPGSVVTTPRTFVDYVVTEYGIATLRGKTIRQRAQELIAVAHPDARAGLRRAAADLHHL
jgi:acyl-CoA hydrolase